MIKHQMEIDISRMTMKQIIHQFVTCATSICYLQDMVIEHIEITPEKMIIDYVDLKA